mmetsp:Transcript_2522/g.4722  ORF Transcript_2522/g.4722 Transcript_2522/m.4722 type:complete len:377 (-) Transcript_2522:1072-2202(-)
MDAPGPPLLAAENFVRLLPELQEVLDGDPGAVAALNLGGYHVQLGVPRVLQGKESRGLPNEHHALPLLVPARDVDRVQDGLAVADNVARPKRPNLITKKPVPREELLILLPHGVPSPTHDNVLLQSEVRDLVLHHRRLIHAAALLVVRLYRPDVVGIALREVVHELVHLLLELGRDRWGLLVTLRYHRVQGFDVLVLDVGLEHLHQVLVELVLVLLEHPCIHVRHVAGVVLDGEVGPAQWGKVLVLNVLVALHREGLVRRPRHDRLLVEQGKNADGALALNELDDGLVVEVIHRLPFDALLRILVLLGPKGELDEELLKLLVAVVDVELLHAVLLEYLKAIDVKYPNATRLHPRALHGGVEFLHDVREGVAVKAHA